MAETTAAPTLEAETGGLFGMGSADGGMMGLGLPDAQAYLFLAGVGLGVLCCCFCSYQVFASINKKVHNVEYKRQMAEDAEEDRDKSVKETWLMKGSFRMPCQACRDCCQELNAEGGYEMNEQDAAMDNHIRTIMVASVSGDRWGLIIAKINRWSRNGPDPNDKESRDLFKLYQDKKNSRLMLYTKIDKVVKMHALYCSDMSCRVPNCNSYRPDPDLPKGLSTSPQRGAVKIKVKRRRSEDDDDNPGGLGKAAQEAKERKEAGRKAKVNAKAALAASKGESLHTPGEVVEAQFEGAGGFFPGTIKTANLDGTYKVTFDDGDNDDAVTESSIKGGKKERKGSSAKKSAKKVTPTMV
jgi:hypothetical protein